MLTISKAIKAGQGEYYLSLAGVDDYYAAGTEPAGYWLGHGAVNLGLEGLVKKEQFRNLLRGLSPDGNRKLVRNADSERRAGWDLTWSAPKSVSVAWSQADGVTREKIEQCLRRAVATGVTYLEKVGGISRRGEDGRIHEAAHLVLACFLHSTSRAQDPQLHVHSVLNNLGIRRDGSTGTLEPQALYRHQMAAGALFRAELAFALETELGLRCRREGRSFELLGVDPDLMTFFSKRRAAIEAELARVGRSGGKAAEAANFATRQKKESRPRHELFEEWQRIGGEHHWSTKELSWLLDAKFPPRDLDQERRSATLEAMAKLTTHESHFCQRQIVQAVAECCQGRGLDAETSLQLSQRLLRSSELVRLCEYRGELHFTTREILALERQVVARAEAMQRRQEFYSSADQMIGDVVLRNPQLGREQREALRHVCASAGGMALVQGMAGTGKSTLFAVAREVWEKQGRSVHGAALSGKAAKGLSEATGIASTTLHRLLSALHSETLSLDRNAVVVLDEASMICTRQLAQVVAACSRSGASLVLCGDSRQLQAIGLGGLFSELSRHLETSQLTEIHRQHEPWARQAVKDFAFGHAEKAMVPYQQRGLVTETENFPSAMIRLLGEWTRDGRADPKSNVILAGTSSDVATLNRQAQMELLEQGRLGSESVQAGEETFYVQDRVLFVRNSSTLCVCNGDLGTVSAIEGQKLRVTLDSGRSVTIDAEGYKHLRLGYALTTHKAQGMTAENTFILTGGSMTDREMSYVQASRARGTTRWYVADELSSVLPQMKRSHEKRAAMSLSEGLELELTLNR